MVDDSQLIAQFSQGYLAARQSLASGNRSAALANYQQLLMIYRAMEAGGMEMLQREFAHDQLTQLYDALNNRPMAQAAPMPQAAPQSMPIPQFAPQSDPAPAPWMTGPIPGAMPGDLPGTMPGAMPNAPSAPPTYAARDVRKPKSFMSSFSSKELLIIGVLVLVIGGVIFVKPEVIGLATLGNMGITVPVDTTFKTGGPLTLTLADIPTSLRLSGQVIGSGTAKVWLVLPAGRKLVMDSSLLNLPAGDSKRIDGACMDTCTLDGASKDITLNVELDNAELVIDSLTYTRRNAVNNPPKFVSPTSTVGLIAGQATTVDLDQFFADPDGDKLAYIAGDTPGVSVDMTGSMLTVTSSMAGSFNIPVVASDGKDVTRVQLELLVR
jgi:hypothetical protein